MSKYQDVLLICKVLGAALFINLITVTLFGVIWIGLMYLIHVIVGI
jgi:hypothetical protein